MLNPMIDASSRRPSVMVDTSCFRNSGMSNSVECIPEASSETLTLQNNFILLAE